MAEKYRYLIVGEDWTVRGTNDEKLAAELAEQEIVVDTQEGLVVNADGDGVDVEITEFRDEEGTGT